jgi:hypothetical protein
MKVRPEADNNRISKGLVTIERSVGSFLGLIRRRTKHEKTSTVPY